MRTRYILLVAGSAILIVKVLSAVLLRRWESSVGIAGWGVRRAVESGA